MECEYIKLAATFGVPSDYYGEEIECAIQVEDGITEAPCIIEDKVTHFLKQRLAGFKVPRKIHIMKELPMSPTGKILRSAVAKTLYS